MGAVVRRLLPGAPALLEEGGRLPPLYKTCEWDTIGAGARSPAAAQTADKNGLRLREINFAKLDSKR